MSDLVSCALRTTTSPRMYALRNPTVTLRLAVTESRRDALGLMIDPVQTRSFLSLYLTVPSRHIFRSQSDTDNYRASVTLILQEAPPDIRTSAPTRTALLL